jgi:hypothetical protein
MRETHVSHYPQAKVVLREQANMPGSKESPKDVYQGYDAESLTNLHARICSARKEQKYERIPTALTYVPQKNRSVKMYIC